ncbi:hypothetical protein [Serratia microhaemolytica]|uniref:hypothetical protein n=1 Tax=Serratia microhaemolytica TaxID=2675110 RepID=UPI000FDD12DD|nr:hypothetical protein [Serratia microhaemolytica]
MLKINELIKYIGLSSVDVSFNEYLQENRIFERPHITEENEGEGEGKEADNVAGSPIEDIERDSISLIYSPRDEYALIYPVDDDTKGEFFLKELAIYGPGIQIYGGHKGTLPFNLSFGLSLDAVHAILREPIATRIVHKLITELYYLDDFVVNISYVENLLSILHIRKAHCFDAMSIDFHKHGVLFDEKENIINYNELIPCIGKNIFSDELKYALPKLNENDIETTDCGYFEIVDASQKNGLTIYYDCAKRFKANRESLIDRGIILAGFRLNRRGDMKSLGYAGTLPFDLKFYYSPEMVINKLNRKPDHKIITDNLAAYMWKNEDGILHILFSLIDYQIYRVSYFGLFMQERLFL